MTNAMLTQVIQIVIMVVAFIPALVLHEVAHRYAAYKLGDPTAKNAGASRSIRSDTSIPWDRHLARLPHRHVGARWRRGCSSATQSRFPTIPLLQGHPQGRAHRRSRGTGDQPRIEPRGRRHCLGGFTSTRRPLFQRP